METYNFDMMQQSANPYTQLEKLFYLQKMILGRNIDIFTTQYNLVFLMFFCKPKKDMCKKCIAFNNIVFPTKEQEHGQENFIDPPKAWIYKHMET